MFQGFRVSGFGFAELAFGSVQGLASPSSPSARFRAEIKTKVKSKKSIALSIADEGKLHRGLCFVF